METIGSRIRQQRRAKDYSQEYMSYMLDMSQSNYSNIENDKTELTITRIYEIAEVLEISPFLLMPPPKSGSGINFGHYLRTLFKLKRTMSKRLQQRKLAAIQQGIPIRDISKNRD